MSTLARVAIVATLFILFSTWYGKILLCLEAVFSAAPVGISNRFLLLSSFAYTPACGKPYEQGYVEQWKQGQTYEENSRLRSTFVYKAWDGTWWKARIWDWWSFELVKAGTTTPYCAITIPYKTWDGSNWEARIDGTLVGRTRKWFTHWPEANPLQTHTDYIMNFIDEFGFQTIMLYCSDYPYMKRAWWCRGGKFYPDGPELEMWP
jgi:hypothetical protein